MRWLTRLRQATAPCAAVAVCRACGTRDATIEEQRVALVKLRAEVTAWSIDAVQNLHAMFTLPLIEEAAARGDEPIDARAPEYVRSYALMFMTECVGLEVGTRVHVAAADIGAGGEPVRRPGTVRDVWVDSGGLPVLFVAMDNHSDTETLTQHGYELAVDDLPGSVAGHGLVVVPFPITGRSIDAGGWIEARS